MWDLLFENKLMNIIPEERIFRDEPMYKHTTFRVGGPAKAYVSVNGHKELKEVLGEERKVSLCRELTKKYETIRRTTLGEAIDEEPKGEYVIVIEGKTFREIEEDERAAWEELTIPEHVDFYEKQGMDRKEAMKMAAKDRGISKRDIYSEMIQK